MADLSKPLAGDTSPAGWYLATQKSAGQAAGYVMIPKFGTEWHPIGQGRWQKPMKLCHLGLARNPCRARSFLTEKNCRGRAGADQDA